MKIRYYVFALILLFAFACKKETGPLIATETPTNEKFIVDESTFGCANYESHEILDEESILNFGFFNFLKYFDYYIYGGNILLIKDDINGNVLLHDTLWISDMLHYENNVIICADEGIYKLDSALNISPLSYLQCDQLIVSSSGEFLFLTHNSSTTINDKVYKLDPSNGDVTPYSAPHQVDGCSSLSNINSVGEDEVWGLVCSGEIARFKNGEFIGEFNHENSPLHEENEASGMVIVPYENDVLVISISPTYKVMKYMKSTEEWKVLLEFQRDLEETDKHNYMHVNYLYNPIVIDNYLYMIAINNAALRCAGIHKINISTNSELEEDDYLVIHDELLPSQCISAIYKHEVDDNIYVITDRKMITKMDCL